MAPRYNSEELSCFLCIPLTNVDQMQYLAPTACSAVIFSHESRRIQILFQPYVGSDEPRSMKEVLRKMLDAVLQASMRLTSFVQIAKQ